MVMIMKKYVYAKKVSRCKDCPNFEDGHDTTCHGIDEEGEVIWMTLNGCRALGRTWWVSPKKYADDRNPEELDDLNGITRVRKDCPLEDI